MATVGKLELIAAKDVNTNTETTLRDLFTYPEPNKELTLDTDVTRYKSGLKMTISKLGASLDTFSDLTGKKGEKTSLLGLSDLAVFFKPVKASQAIKKGEALTVNIETGPSVWTA